MSSIKVSIKWGKQRLKDVEVNLEESPEVFAGQIYTLTGVPPERQKIMGIRGVKAGKMDADDWSKYKIKNGQSIMLVGTAGELPKAPTEKTIFVEDLPQEQQFIGEKLPPGLTNLGNTCYMNSTLQCLNAIPELNKALVKYSGDMSMDQDHNITVSLRDLFVEMKHSGKGVIKPVVFLQFFRSAFPQFAQTTSEGIPMQQDAEECLYQIITCLSKKLLPLEDESGSTTKSTPANAVMQLFGGEYSVTTKCLESEEEAIAVRSEEFRKLDCHIGLKDKPNFLLEGLKKSQTEILEKRSSVLSRDAQFEVFRQVSKLPYYLNVSFIRFFWKPGAAKKAKVLWPVEFPFILDIYDLCTPELQAVLKENRDRLLKKDEGSTSKSDTEEGGTGKEPAEESEPMEEEKKKGEDDVKRGMSNETGMYELYAVLTHRGRSADSGHYVSWVKQDDGGWVCFDDDKVYTCEEKDIKMLQGKASDWHISYVTFWRTVHSMKQMK